MKKTTFLVEFSGLPGVGKSVLSSRIAEILLENGIAVEQSNYYLSHQVSRMKRVFYKALYVIKELLLHPWYAFISIKTILKTQQKSAADFITVVFNWFFVSSLIRSNKKYKGVRLFDEGIFQALWSVAFSGKKDSLTIMKPLFSMMPLPQIIIVPEASLATIQKRMSGRERHDSRLEKGSTDFLELAGTLFTEIKGVLKSLAEQDSNLHLYCVKNEREEALEVNAKKIATDIEHIFNSQRF